MATALFLLNYNPGYSGTHARWYWYTRWALEIALYSEVIVMSKTPTHPSYAPLNFVGKIYYENALLHDMHQREYDIVEKLIHILSTHQPKVIEVWYGHPYLKYLAMLPKELTSNIRVIVRHAGSDLYYHFYKFPSFLKAIIGTIANKFKSIAVLTDAASQTILKKVVAAPAKIMVEAYRPLFWNHLLEKESNRTTIIEKKYDVVYFGKWKRQILTYLETVAPLIATGNNQQTCTLFIDNIPVGLQKKINLTATTFLPVTPCKIPDIITQSNKLLIIENQDITAPNHQSRVYRESLFLGKSFVLPPANIPFFISKSCNIAKIANLNWKLCQPIEEQVISFRLQEKQHESLYLNFIKNNVLNE